MTPSQPDTLSEIIFEIWGSAIHSADLKELSASIRNSLSRIIDVANFYICLYNREKDSLTLLYRIDQTEPIKKYENYYIEQVSESSRLTAEVIKRGQSILIHKEDDLQKARSADKKIVGTPAEVWLGVPLKIEDKVQGVLVVQSYTNPEQYDRAQKELLEALAEPIAAALEYKKMEETQSRDEAIKRTLFNIASAVNLTHDLKDLYRSIHQTLKQVIDLPNFFIGFYDKQKGVIDYPYLADEFDFPQIGQTSIQVQSEDKYSLSMQVIETGKALRLNKEKIFKTLQENGKTPVGTIPEIWLGFPLKTRNETIGIMGTQSYTDPFHFTEKEIGVMGSVGDQIAIAIDRKRAEEKARKRAERLTGINRIGRMSATVDTLDQLLQAIYEEINGIFKPDAFFIAFFDQKNNELEFRLLIEENQRQPSLRVPLRRGFSSKVILDRKPLVIRDYEREKENLPPGLLFGNQKHALSWIGVPLIYRDQVIGLVNIQSYQSQTWNDEDIQFFFTIADQLAGMLEKARLFEEARKHAERLAVVNRIGRLSATAGNLDQLLEAIYLEINGIFKPDSFFISFFDQRSNELEFVFLMDGNKRELDKKRVPLGNGFSAKVIRDQKPLVIRDYEHERDHVPQGLRFNGNKPALSWIGVPLKYGNQIIGLVNIQSYRANVWNEEDIQLFFTIADQIAGTIEKMRLFEEASARAERLTVINRIGKAAATADNLDQLMTAIYEEIEATFKPNAFFIAFFDQKTDELEFRFHINTTNGKLPVMRRLLGDGFCAKVIRERKTLIIKNYEKENELLPRQIVFGDQKPAISWVGVPLMLENQIMGVVSIQSYAAYAWNDEDIQLFFTITDQITGSIEKARLFEEARARAERLTVINRIGKAGETVDNLDKLMEAIYEEIHPIFKPGTFFIAFLDRKTDELETRFLIENEKRLPVARYPLGNGLSSKVILEKKPLIIHHYDQEQDHLPKQILFGDFIPSQSWIGVPLKFEDQIIGLVNIQSQRSNVWNEEDIQLFFTIADQISGSIAKARLFEDANRRAGRLAVLNRIGMLAASAQNIDQMFNNIYEEIDSIFKPDTFFIAFYDATADELEFKILMDEGQKSENQRVPIGNGLSSKVIAEKRPLVINHYEKEKSNLPRQMTGGK
ncbi:MAG: GAF domain-containing protein, partial [Desulfobacteraceae bacterium]